MNITIAEFSKERKVDRIAVNQWIRKHPEVAKFCKKVGKEKLIDTESEAFRILEKKYPLPKPVEVIVDTEAQKKLMQAQELIIQLQDKIIQLGEKNAILESQNLLLEDHERQLAEELEKLRNRPLWRRIVNKI